MVRRLVLRRLWLLYARAERHKPQHPHLHLRNRLQQTHSKTLHRPSRHFWTEHVKHLVWCHYLRMDRGSEQLRLDQLWYVLSKRPFIKLHNLLTSPNRPKSRPHHRNRCTRRLPPLRLPYPPVSRLQQPQSPMGHPFPFRCETLRLFRLRNRHFPSSVPLFNSKRLGSQP